MRRKIISVAAQILAGGSVFAAMLGEFLDVCGDRGLGLSEYGMIGLIVCGSIMVSRLVALGFEDPGAAWKPAKPKPPPGKTEASRFR